VGLRTPPIQKHGNSKNTSGAGTEGERQHGEHRKKERKKETEKAAEARKETNGSRM